MKCITILLAEDHTVVREGFRKILELEDDFKVVGEVEDGRQAVAMAKTLRPDVVLMDISMPLLNGLEATRQLLKIAPATKVIMLSAQSDIAYVKDSIDAGARGFLQKQTTARALYQAIREIQNGNAFFSPAVAKGLHKRARSSMDRSGSTKTKTVDLTSREREVLQLIAEGKTNKETAAELGISIKTVESHRANLMEKLDIHETAGLTRYAIGTGVIASSVRLILV
jgi:DNA-binding NarL/FixJ family response regulator